MFWESPYKWSYDDINVGPQSDKDNYLLLLKELQAAFASGKLTHR